VARVLLLNPPGPWPSSGPLPGLLYLAAAAQRAGHELRLRDLAAPCGPDRAALRAELEQWQPDVLGVSLYTELALGAYELLAALPRGAELRVAGGPHATVAPREALRSGFDLALVGEGEVALSALLDALDARGPRSVCAAPPAGFWARGADGRPHRAGPQPPPVQLDDLAPPSLGLSAAASGEYSAAGEPLRLRSLLSSRGCPGTCRFCANQVTGRRVRLHSDARVLADLRDMARGQEHLVFGVHDDAFTAQRARTLRLCAQWSGADLPPLSWWCESRVAGFDGEVARALAQAGCRAVVFGVESGDAALRAALGKPLSDAEVLAALAAARAAGLQVVVNTLFGLPGETVLSLRRSARFLEAMAPWVDSFSALGVLLPYPGTAVYAAHAARCGFERWWLDAARLRRLHAPWCAVAGGGQPWPQQAREIERAALAEDFFQLGPEVLAATQDCLDLRRSLGGGASRAAPGEPAGEA